MNRERLEQLARRVWAERSSAAAKEKRMRTQEPPYYIMNLGHPVIRALYDSWKAGVGLRREDAPGDVERTIFELQLLDEKVRQAIEERLNREEQIRAGTGNVDGQR